MPISRSSLAISSGSPIAMASSIRPSSLEVDHLILDADRVGVLLTLVGERIVINHPLRYVSRLSSARCRMGRPLPSKKLQASLDFKRELAGGSPLGRLGHCCVTSTRVLPALMALAPCATRVRRCRASGPTGAIRASRNHPLTHTICFSLCTTSTRSAWLVITVSMSL